MPGAVARYIPATSCILIPFAVLIFYQKTVDQVRYHIKVPAAVILNSEYTDCPLPDADKAFEDQAGRRPEVLSIRRQSDDVSGRYEFGTTSAALQMLALAGMLFSMAVILRRTHPLTGSAIGLGALGLGTAMFEQPSRADGTRQTLVIPILDAAQLADRSFDGTQKDLINHIVNFNSWFGFTAVVFILFALGVVAIRARKEELEAAVLRQRLFDFRWLMILAAAILVLTVVIPHALIDWSASHLCEAYRDGLKPAGNALANYWGLGSSGVLLGALLPSYFSWGRDVENWAATKSAANATEKDRETLIASEGLDFAPTASVSALLTVAIPALSGPILELLKSIPVLAGH